MSSSTRKGRRLPIDLNRELPPLPPITPVQPLNVKKKINSSTQLELCATKQEGEMRTSEQGSEIHASKKDSEGKSHALNVTTYNDRRPKTFIPPPRNLAMSGSQVTQSASSNAEAASGPPVPSLQSTIALLREYSSMDSFISNNEATGEDQSHFNEIEDIMNNRRLLMESAETRNSTSIDELLKYLQDMGNQCKGEPEGINVSDPEADVSDGNITIVSASDRSENHDRQHDPVEEKNNTLLEGLGVTLFSNQLQPPKDSNYDRVVPSDNLGITNNTGHAFELEPDNPTAKAITQFYSSGSKRAAAANPDSNIKYKSQSYSSLSRLALDEPNQKGLDRFTTWTDVQGMSGLSEIIEDYMDPAEGTRNQEDKAQGKVETALAEKVKRNGNISGKRPELIQATRGHMSSIAVIEGNEFFGLPSANSGPVGPVMEAGRYDKPSGSTMGISPRNQHRNSFPGTGRLVSSAERQRGNIIDYREASRHPSQPRSQMKKLFGEGGWLGESYDLNLEKPSSKRDIIGMIKGKIGDIGAKADFHSSARKDSGKPKMTTTTPTSLRDDEQASIMAQVELILCRAANKFLLDQYAKGRMLSDSIKKVADSWRSKGRAEVIEFKYDQLTQCELVMANQKNFCFHGKKAHEDVHISAMLYTWRQNAKEMGVRTYCSPDSMIEKHLFDSYKILEILGGKSGQYDALRVVHQYFRDKIAKRARLQKPQGSGANRRS